MTEAGKGCASSSSHFGHRHSYLRCPKNDVRKVSIWGETMSDKPAKARAVKPRPKQLSVDRSQAIVSAFSVAPAYANTTQIAAGIGTVRMAFGEATPNGANYSHAIVVTAKVAERFAKQLAMAAEDAKQREAKAADENLIEEDKVQVEIDDE